MLDDTTPPSAEQQYRDSFQELADARRVLKVTNSLRQAPVLSIEERLELEKIRGYAVRCIEAATAELIETLDALDDPDVEDDDSREDDNEDRCVAADDDQGRQFSDGLPGDEADREEDDHSGDPLDDGELGSCHGAHC